MQTQEISLSNLLEIGWAKGMSYQQYRLLVQKLALEKKSTGPIQTESLIDYTMLNDRRMKRWDKVLKLDDETVLKIKKVNQRINWLVLTESWCGDASPALPVMNKISELNPNISFKILLRDENLELMNQFLTNGSMSIPKLISFDATDKDVMGTWGSRSKAATELVEDFKREHGELTAEFKQNLQIWYNKDKGNSILKDLLSLLSLK
ncbi:thioredoxin family protein [Maribacter sp. PR1]|uniref:Thioredoxin family protein n=1 Tax=Maribacter cobaltidurans TaxID=1178778 RepID=A0ABU7IRJ1_9FLAO|nr:MULTISPECIES: thioredoxin family protein [Maribacter]MDC6388187.1 thioredoxin family protein [Maribacter sp. PR1]MEE1975575.1 thioredoxin family protein [Maribacter cobaltidurans]